MPVAFQYTETQSQVAVTDAGFMCLGYGLAQSFCCQQRTTRFIDTAGNVVSDTGWELLDDTCVYANQWPNGDGTIDWETLWGRLSRKCTRTRALPLWSLGFTPRLKTRAPCTTTRGTLVNGF